MDWASSTLVGCNGVAVAGTGAYTEGTESQEETSVVRSPLGEDHGGNLEGYRRSRSAWGDRKELDETLEILC